MSLDFRSLFWITLQMLLALIGLHSERVTVQSHPYISEFQYVPEYHPSKNPGCVSQWSQREFYEGRFGDRIHQRSSCKEQVIDRDHPWIEIRAVLGHCTKKRKEIGKMFYRQQIRNCKRKLIISMKINNVGKTNTREEFVLVDHVLDPVGMHKIRLRNPFVIKVRQESLLHLYGLRFQGIVNAEAREEVINNHRTNFTGCKDDLDNPTCGKMLINGKPIPYSQGFCCSCEDVTAQRAGSFYSTVAKSNHYQRDDSANGARNRSESSTNLFDNSKAQRQIVANGYGECSRAGPQNSDARGRITSHNIFVVNGLLGERASSLREHQEKEQLRNNPARQLNRSSEGSPGAENGNNMQTPSPMLKSLFLDPMPSKAKIEAFIDTVYEQAMKERSMKQSVLQEDNERNDNLLDDRDRAGNRSNPKTVSQESNLRINGDRYPIYGTVADYSQGPSMKLMNAGGEYNISKSESRTSSPQFFSHRSDDRYLIHGSATDNSQNATAKLIKLKNERDFTKMNSEEDNRKFLELDKCDKPENFSERGNREETPRDRSCGAIRLENTLDYTPTFLAIHLSRIPEGSQFSRRTQKNVLPNALSDNGSLATTIEFFASSEVPFRSINKNINCAVTPAIELNGFVKEMFSMLSSIMISGKHSSTESGDREFRIPESISSNVNASRNASIEWRNLSAAAIPNDNANGEKRKAENANVSTRFSTAPAFTRLRNFSSPTGISKLEELSGPIAAARARDKSSTRILENSRTRSSLLTNEVQEFSDDFGNLYENQESRRIYNSPKQAPKDVNLKNSYKFWRSHQKLRKLKDIAKFYKGKSIAENLKHFEKSLSDGELITQRASPDFKHDRFQNGLSKREKRSRRRLRRHLRTGKKPFNFIQRDELDHENSHRETQAFINYHMQPQVVHSKRKMSENNGNGNPTKQVILEPNQSYRKVQPEESDNPFIFSNEGGKESNIDKRIEDRFARISNVLKEDSTEARIIQEAPESFQVVAKSKDARTDIPKIHDRLKDDLFLQRGDKFNESSVTQDDEVTRKYSAELITTHQLSTMNDNFRATAEPPTQMMNNEVITISSAITWKNNNGKFAFHELEGRLSDTIIGPFLSSPITRKPKHHVSKKVNFTKLTNSIYPNIPTRKRMGFLTQELSSMIRDENTNDYSEITDGPFGTLSSSWKNSKQATTSPRVLNNRSEGKRDGVENARFLEFNNNSLRMIAGNSARPRGPPIAPGLSLRGSGSVTEPRASPRNEEGESPRYNEDALAENLRDSLANQESSEKSLGSQEKDEIAKLVDRIVRQYAAYTPIMPGMPTFDEITEPETLPPEAKTTVTQFTSVTALATTTRITDKAFRPSIRPLQTTPLPGEMHDEISLDETTFVDETEATMTNRKTTTAKWKFQAGRSQPKSALPGKARKVSSKTKKSGKPKQKITSRITISSMKLLDGEGKTEVHPWYRTTEVQQIIAANRSKLARNSKEGKKKQRYESKVEYFGDSTSSDWSSSTIASSSVTDEVAQTRSKRADFIRESRDRTSSVFCDYEEGDEEDRRSGRTATNKSEESPDMVEPNGLRSGIEKRLAGELDYPATRESSRRSCESEKRTQEHNVALENIVARDVGLRTVDDGQQKKEQDRRGSLKNFTSMELYYTKDDTVSKLNEGFSPKDRHKVISVSIDTPSPDPVLRKDLSGSMYERVEIHRRTEEDVEKRAFGERMAAKIDRIVAVREMAVNLSENARTASVSADDLLNRSAEPREQPATNRILLNCVKSPGDQDKGRKTDTVIRGAKLMMANDKDETRDLDVAAKSGDETILPSFAAAKHKPGCKDARKINENSVDDRVHRISTGKEYFRRPRGNMRDIIHRIIGKFYHPGKSSSTSAKMDIDTSIVGSEEGVDRSPLDWHRSGRLTRRLLSSRESSYVEDADDEYYEDDGETGGENNSASDNKAIAKSEDLSGFANQPGLHEDRDRRKLAVKPQRLVGENIDNAAGTMMPQEKIIAVHDTTIISDDVQAVGEGTISRNNEKKILNKNTNSEGKHDIDTVLESTNTASFNNDNTLEASNVLSEEEKSIARSAANNNISVQKKSFDDPDNGLRISQTYEEVDEEPLSFREKMNEDNLEDESLYEIQSTSSTFNNKEITNYSINQDLLNTEQIFRNVDSSQTSKSEGSIKISLSGRIQVNGGSNQTPMLISFDAIPEEASATQSSASAAYSNVMVAIETTVINLPLNNSNVEFAFNFSSTTDRENDKTNDSLDAIWDESREVGEANANGVAIKSREKFFDLARRNEMERKTVNEASSRIQKRLDKDNLNSRTAKQIFLTDYSRPLIAPSGKMDKTSAGRTIFDRISQSKMANLRKDKLNFRPSTNSVRFPDILGSVLVNNDRLKHQDAVKAFQCRIGTSSIEANRSDAKTDRSNKTTLHIVPLVHIKIEKPNVNPVRDESNETKCCPEDSRNAISGGCHRMPTTIQKLPKTTKLTSRESQTTSNYRVSDSTTTFQPGDYVTTKTDWSTETMEFSAPSTKLKDIFKVATECTTNKTLHSEASCKCGDESVNAIRVRNMMAIVRFMMKLLRITDDEEPACRNTQIGETMIRVNSIVVNVSSTDGDDVGKQRSTADKLTMITSGRVKQDLTTIEWRSTITERIYEESLSLDDSTFKPFTEAPAHSAASILPTSSGKAFKDEKLSTSFKTSTGREVYTSTLSSTTSSSTPKSFLFYKPERKSLHKDVASWKNVSIELTGVKQNSNVSFNDSKENSERRKSRLDSSQRNRASSRTQNQDRSSVDRLRIGKQEIASTTNSEKDNIDLGSSAGYLAKNKGAGFRRSKLADVASSDTIRPMLSRDIAVSRDALLDGIGAIRGDTSKRLKSKQAKKAKVSDRRVKRTKLLNSSARRDSSGDWIGKRRAATRQLPVDKKRRESREVPSGTATLEKVVFRRARDKINRLSDPNLGIGKDDSFKIDVHAGSGFAAKPSMDDTSSNISRGLSSSDRADSYGETNAIRHLPIFSSLTDNVRISRSGKEIMNKHMSTINKKRNVKHREIADFQKNNRVFRKRQKNVSPTRKKIKWEKKKRKKGGQRTKDISQTINQQRFKRRLLMMLLEPELEYDADAWTRRYITEDFREPVKGNAKRREDGSRMVIESEVDSNRAQIRGGQDCTDLKHPPNVDMVKYLESAHCLRFSDLWYSVYQLEDPIVEHTMHLQVYEKRILANGSTYWADLTEDSVVRLGTFNRHHRGSKDTIAFAYKEVKTPGREEEKREAPNLDVARDRLLMPSSVTSKGSGYPAEGESDEYLVVPASSINVNGNECDKAGVGFAAFARQPDRCGRVRGTCLKNQPLAYRKHDTEARAAGRPGCYFLSNFASVPSEPIKYSANGSGSREFLALEYHSPHVSAIDIEIRVGYNAALAGGSSGCINEVHVDNTVLDHTIIMVVVINTGLTSASYRLEIVNCPDSLPKSWMSAAFSERIIQPRHNQAVSLNLYGELSINEFYCSVRLLNHLGESVATRRIKIRKMDRCSCVLHCLCMCMGDARGRTCQPMSPKLYHGTGCRNLVPTASDKIFSHTTVDVLLFIALLILLLIFMGFLKWFIGLYVPAVSRWGLDFLLGNSRISEYYERELKCKNVVTDENGAPVHPDTRKRTVRICSRKVEFFLNAIFFLIFPLAVCCYRLKKSFRPARRHCCSTESKISLTSGSIERSKTICVSTYGQDSQGSKMEAEDTKYVIDELRKSEASLRNHSRNKVSGSNKETDNSSKVE